MKQRGNGGQRGSALVTALIVTFLIGGLALVTLTISSRTQQEATASNRRLEAFYAAEAGLNVAWVELQNGGDGVIGSAEAPASLGGLTYYVETNDVDDDVQALIATGSDGQTERRVELVVQDMTSEVTGFGIFGDRGVTLRSNSTIDSYNSSLGTYASQVSGGHAKNNGNVGSNDNITVASNAKVFGYSQYGPDAGDTISIASNVTLLDGYGAAETHVALPAVTVPSYASSGALTVSGSKTIWPGNLQYTTLTTNSNSSLLVKGPCNLVITSAAQIKSNSTWTFDATNGPITIYALGSFELRSNATVATTSKDPSKLTLNLTGTHSADSSSSPKIDFSSNSSFYGTVYAPNLSVVISSNFELYGMIRSRWLELSSNSKIHFDEQLTNGNLDVGQGYEVLGWRELEGQLEASGDAP